MKILDVEQGSLEWLSARSGIPTASEADALITPLWKIKTGDGPRTFLVQKLAEWFQGGPLPSFESFAMEQGTILEAECIPWFEFTHNAAVRRVGFITTDDGLAGCSPDGLLSDEEGIEIKAPQADTQVRYLLDGVLPKQYEIQVHFSMFVTGFKRWRFLSYRRNFPAFLLTVERDEEKQAIIAEALDRFHQVFDDAKEQLIAINGGPPRTVQTPKAPPVEPDPEPTLLKARPKLHEMGITP